MKILTAHRYLKSQGLANGIVDLVHRGNEYFVLTDYSNSWTFNAAGVLVATNEDK